jgi:tetratricopeptide (TPR) repeat protein
MDREAELFQAAVEARPHCWRPYWWLGMNSYRRGEFKKAVVPFRKLIEHAPDFHRGYSLLGAMHLLEGEYGQAVDLLERAIELHPTGTDLSNLGTAYFSKRDFERTIRTYNKALGSEFVNYRVWLNLGDAYFWAPGKRKGARGAYEEALELGKKEREERPYDVSIDADLAMIHANLAEADSSRVGDMDSARVYLASALEGGASDPIVQYSAALVSWQFGDKDAAFSHLERSVAEGFSVKSVRDWAVFDAWRDDPRYRAVVGDSTGTAPR